jgi:hypothetical protein
MANLVSVTALNIAVDPKLQEDITDLHGDFISHMVKMMPLESEFGTEHTVEALLTVAEQLSPTSGVVEYFSNLRSNDPTAKQAVTTKEQSDDGFVAHIVEIALPFMQALDVGGMIRPISPGGEKTTGVNGIGLLYAPRSAIGYGFLMWHDPSNPNANEFGRVYARQRYLEPLNFIHGAASELDATALSKGYTRG